MMSRIWLVGAAVAAVTGCAGGTDVAATDLHPHFEGWSRTAVEVHTDGATHEVDALVAATPERRKRGLQQVEEVPDGTGMLFVFERDRDSGFWMKDTLVPLEIAFAAHDGRIVEVLSMEPCDADPCPVYRPQASYRVALEVPDGWLDERDVGPGDRLEWGEVPEAR